MTSNPAFALVALPLLGASLAGLAKVLPQGRAARILENLGAGLGLGLPFLVLALSYPGVVQGQAVEGVLGLWHPSVGIAYRFDGLAWALDLLGFTLGLSAWIYTQGAGPRGASFTTLFLVQTAALAATAMTADLFNLFVCLEVMGMTSYVLVTKSQKPGAFLASYSYLMVSATAMVFFLLGVYGLYRLTGALSYHGIVQGLAALGDGGGLSAGVSIALIVGAVAIRVAVMPVYGWLPDAHAMAPHAVSAVLSGVMVKTPLFALGRFLMVVPEGAQAGELMGGAGAVTALVAAFLALVQSDAKRLLAYSTVSQIGYVVAAWGAAIHLGPSTPRGALVMGAALLHAFFHAITKGLLFMSVGTLIDATGERRVDHLDRFGGTFSLVTLALGALSIAGLPPLNGFSGKTALGLALAGRWEYGVLWIAGLGTMAAFIRLSRVVWHRPRPVPAEAVEGEEAPPQAEATPPPPPEGLAWRHGAQALLALACLVTGLAGGALLQVATRLVAGQRGLEGTLAPLFGWSSLGSSALTLALGMVLYVAAVHRPLGPWLAGLGGRPRGFQGLLVAFVMGTLALAAWMAWAG